ncbi:MAG: trypsin-like peptidase domain-containing protein [Actinomycetota bacterium]|nr:trypsin-like peptidase domain-containing protein [Actinomycetota bacterium]
MTTTTTDTWNRLDDSYRLGAGDGCGFEQFDTISGSGGWPPPPVGSPAMPAGPPHRRRGGRRLFLASITTAALVGGAAGYVAGTVAESDHEPTTVATTVDVTPLTYADSSMNVTAIAATVEPSVVTIAVQLTVRQGPRSYSGSAAGTGIVLTADGQVLTNAHVVADATSITVTLAGESTAREARLIGADGANDIALIQIIGVSDLTPAAIGRADEVVVGQDVVAIGNALDLDGDVSVTRGIISALHRTVQLESGTLTGMLQTDTAISSGNSGGPLVNAAGAVIGVITAGATSSGTVTAENIGFAITIDHALEIVAALRSAA